MTDDFDTAKLLKRAAFKLALEDNDVLLSASALFSLIGTLLTKRKHHPSGDKPLAELVDFIHKKLAKSSLADLLSLQLTKQIGQELSKYLKLPEFALPLMQINYYLRDSNLPVLRRLHLANPCFAVLLARPLPSQVVADLLEALQHYVVNHFTTLYRRKTEQRAYVASFIHRLVAKQWTFSEDRHRATAERIVTAITSLEQELWIVEGSWKKVAFCQAISALVERAQTLRLSTRGNAASNIAEAVKEKNGLLEAIGLFNKQLDVATRAEIRPKIVSLASIVLSGLREEMQLIVVDSKVLYGDKLRLMSQKPTPPNHESKRT